MAGNRVTPWLLELGRSAPGLVRSYLPGGPVDARTRERIILAVTEVNGCRWCAWVHGAWAEYLGEGVEDPEAAEQALLDYARACARAGRPLDPTPLAAVLPASTVAAVRATVAQIGVAGAVGSRADDLLARLTLRRRPDVVRAAVDALSVAAALPVAMPVLATAAAMRVVNRLAPPVPSIHAPDGAEANLLVHLLARTVPAYLANAGIRLAVLRLPLPVTVALRTGQSAATVRLRRGGVEVVNGVAPDALMVLEGDIEPLLQVATGSLLRELASLRVRRD